MKEECIMLELSLPPSVNECFTGYPKRVKSNVYKKRLNLARSELLTQTKYEISGDEWLDARITVFTNLYYKNGKKKKQDLDNWLKPLFDFLGNEIEGFKDEYIKSIIAEKRNSDKNIVKILIKELK